MVTGERQYDIVIYGASGFTGQYAAAEMVRTCAGKKMAIAGRNEVKLTNTLKFVQKELNLEEELSGKIGILVADSADDQRIQQMCAATRVVVSCVGPFSLHGERVVRNCVVAGTHYVDISGEAEFLQQCQIDYHELAVAKKVHVVGACGFGSVPADVGLELFRVKFPGKLTSVESYICVYGTGKANFGTYNTIIRILAEGDRHLKEQDELIFDGKEVQYLGPELKAKVFRFNKSFNKWIIPFQGTDPSVVRRTQLFESMQHKKTPLQFHSYLAISSLVELFVLIIFGLNLFIFTRFSWGVKLLQRFPRFFSFGMFSKEGPTRDDIASTSFSMTFEGKGYKVNEGGHQVDMTGPPDVSATMKLTGCDPGYLLTSIAAVGVARTLLDDQLKNEGGVLTPGSAMSGTKYVDRLIERGLKIEMS